MEDKGKKATRRTVDVTWNRSAVNNRKTLKTGCTDYLALLGIIRLVPIDCIGGYEVRPGFYRIGGTTATPGGVNFTVYPHGATTVELPPFGRTGEEPYAVLPFPKHHRIGNVYSVIVSKLNIGDFEYAHRVDGPYEPEKGLIFDKNEYLLDPYAKAVTGQNWRGDPLPGCQHYKARVVKDDFDWADTAQPLTSMEDLIIYELHVRGSTMHGPSTVLHPGTFDGLMEKLPYLLELGVNVVELMPIFESDEMQGCREVGGQKFYNYWGYNTVNFLAPDTGYTVSTEHNREDNELKNLIRVFSQHGTEIYLDMIFNHTAEGGENGLFFSSKGFDNNICYLLTPKGYYCSSSGYGNTLNYSHPIVRQMVLNCLRYWVIAYRADGFHSDLASTMAHNEDGAPVSKSPLLQSFAFDPIPGDVKLIAETWDVDDLYQVRTFPSWNCWTEWSGGYRNDIRRHIKGDQGMAQAAALRIAGSGDIYADHDRKNASVSFVACRDGSTLYDLSSCNVRYSRPNGWDNTDGANDNNSWNCGAEGETDDPQVEALRRCMVRNVYTLLMCSRGIPMFPAGDELCSTQFSNNNVYCQDNEISWLDRERLGQYRDIPCFFQYMIRFRKTHRLIRTNVGDGACGFPDMSFHGVKPWCASFVECGCYVGVVFTGQEEGEGSRSVYIASGAYWEPLDIKLSVLPGGMEWELAANTWENVPCPGPPGGNEFRIRPRTVMVTVGKQGCFFPPSGSCHGSGLDFLG